MPRRPLLVRSRPVCHVPVCARPWQPAPNRSILWVIVCAVVAWAVVVLGRARPTRRGQGRGRSRRHGRGGTERHVTDCDHNRRVSSSTSLLDSRTHDSLVSGSRADRLAESRRTEARRQKKVRHHSNATRRESRDRFQIRVRPKVKLERLPESSKGQGGRGRRGGWRREERRRRLTSRGTGPS